jgi:hypothetical protein
LSRFPAWFNRTPFSSPPLKVEKVAVHSRKAKGKLLVKSRLKADEDARPRSRKRPRREKAGESEEKAGAS